MPRQGSSIAVKIIPANGDPEYDITNRVLFRSASFESQIGAMPGTFTVTVNDIDQTLSFVTGDELTLTIDGVKMWGGYILNVARNFAFPAVDTSTPANVMARRWTLTGSDYNILFDKRVIHDPNNHLKAFDFFPLDKTMGWLLRNQLLSDYVDIDNDGLYFDSSTVENTFVPRFDEDGNPDPDGTKEGTWPQQGSLWRAAMDDFAQFGCIYYINADKEIHFHEAESITAGWGFSDKPNKLALPNAAARYPMREFEETDDASGMVNDAFVWGGSEWASNPGKIKFARKKYQPSIDAHNTWQYAETRFGELKTARMVKARANVIVMGNTTGSEPVPGTVGGDTQRGLSIEQHQIRCAWYGHDVPELAGQRQHLRPGQVVPFSMFVLSADGLTPMLFNLPLRSIRISFPNLDPDGDAYVRFDGFFGVQYSDPWWLWKYLRDTSPSIIRKPWDRATVTNDDTAALYGAEGSFEPWPAPNGSRKTFSIPFSYIGTTFRVFKNGKLVSNSAYTKSPTTGEFTFDTAPGASDELWVLCVVSGGIE